MWIAWMEAGELERKDLKQYVAVEARFDEGGGVRPLCVIWEDGRRFPVDRVMDVRRAASLKAGGTGLRYRCLIGGRERNLFYEDPRWFVEMQAPRVDR